MIRAFWRGPRLRNVCSIGCRHVSSKNPGQIPTFDQPSGFSKFTPLPNKMSNGEPVYTGRPLGSSDLSYYTRHLETQPPLSRKKLHLELMKILSIALDETKTTYVGSYICRKVFLETGDLIEVVQRDGNTCFGVVVYEDGQPLLLCSDSKDPRPFNKSTISFIMKNVYQGKALTKYLSDQDSRSIFIAHLTTHLHLLLRDSLVMALKISAKRLPPVLSQSSRTFNLSAVSLDIAAQSMHKYHTRSLKLSTTRLLATYFSLAFQSLRSSRPSISTPFVALSAPSYAAVDKIMNNLAHHELDHFVDTLKHRINGTNEGFSEGALGPLLVFLHHYILCPDLRLAPAVSTLLSRVYPEADSDSWLTAPSSVFKMLSQAGLADPEDPFLSSAYGIFWKSKSSTTICQLADDLESTVVDLYDPDHKSIGLQYSTTIADSKARFFTFTQASDIAFSVSLDGSAGSNYFQTNNELSDTVSGLLQIILPDMTKLGDISSEMLSAICRRCKSVELPQGVFHLLPSVIRDDLLFKEGPSMRNVFRLQIPFEISDSRFQLDWSSSHAEMVLLDRNPIISVDAREIDGDNMSEYSELGHAYRIFKNCFEERIERGAIDDFSQSAQPYSFSLYHSSYTAFHMIQEARITAGRIFGQYCANNGIPAVYLSQKCLSDSSGEELSKLTVSRRINGTLKESMRALAAPYYGIESYSEDSHSEHVGLGCSSYVDLGSPLDNCMHILAQYDFVHAASINRSFRRRARGIDSSATHISSIIAREQLIACLKAKLVEFYKLSQLEKELHGPFQGYYIFRCVITGDAEYPSLAKGYCHELGMEVDISLAPGTKVNSGNTVVCTEILELNTVDGLLVVGL